MKTDFRWFQIKSLKTKAITSEKKEQESELEPEKVRSVKNFVKKKSSQNE